MSDKIALPELSYGEGMMFHYKDDLINSKKLLFEEQQKLGEMKMVM